MALVANFGLTGQRSAELLVVAAVFGFIFLANLALVAIPGRLLHKIVGLFSFTPKRLVNVANLMIRGWETIRTDRSLIVKLFLLNIAIISMIVVESSVIFGLFVDDWRVSSVLLYAVLGTLSTLVSVTPGAVGVKEAIFLFSATVTAITPDQILQMATIDRSATFILLVISYAVVKILKLDKKTVAVGNKNNF